MPRRTRSPRRVDARRRVSEALGFAVALTTLQTTSRGAYAVPLGPYACQIDATYNVLPGGIENTTAGCTVTATGELYNAYSFSNDAAMTNDGTIDNQGTFANNATLDNGGTLLNSLIGTFTNGPTGTLNNLATGSFYNTGPAYNDGALNNLGLLTVHDTGTLANRVGGHLVNDNALYVTYGAGVSNAYGATITNNGGFYLAPEIVYGAGPTLGLYEPASTLLNGGTLNNTGTLLSYHGEITNEATGDITNGAGGSYGNLYNNSGTLANAGTLTNGPYGFAMNGYGATLTNQAGGVVENQGILLNYFGSTIANEAGATFTIASYAGLYQAGGYGGAYYGGGGQTTFSNVGTLTNDGFFGATNFAVGLSYGAGRSLIANSGTFDNNGNMNLYAYFDAPGAGAPDGDVALENTGTFNNSGYFYVGAGSYYGGLYAVGPTPGSALLRNESELNNTGTLVVDEGGLLDNTPTGVVNNSGDLVIHGGWSEAGLTNNADPGAIANYGTSTITGTVRSEGELSNEGTFNVAAGGAVRGLPDGYGTVVYGAFTQYSGSTLVNGEMVQSVVDVLGGTLAGDGRVSGIGGGVNAFAGSTVSPGNSPGTLQVGSDFTCTLCTLIVEIAGDGAGEFDVLEVSGEAALTGGHIDFTFLGGFTPVLGDTFDFLVAADVTDFSDFTFAFLNVALGPGLFFDVSQLTVPGTGFVPGPNAQALRLAVAAVPLPPGAWLLGAGLAGLAMLRRTRPAG